MIEYRRYNANADEAQMAGVRSDMEKLIGKKLEMFPTDLRQIVGARIVQSGGQGSHRSRIGDVFVTINERGGGPFTP